MATAVGWYTMMDLVFISYPLKAGKGLGDLHTNEGACFGKYCSVYQIKTIETKGSEFPCSEYPVSLSVRQKVGGRLWVMSYVSLGNANQILFTTVFLTNTLLMSILYLLFCDTKNYYTEETVSIWGTWSKRCDTDMKDEAHLLATRRNNFQTVVCCGCVCFI